MKFRFALASKRGTFDVSWEPKVDPPKPPPTPPPAAEQKPEPRVSTGTHHARQHTTQHLGFSTPATDRRKRIT